MKQNFFRNGAKTFSNSNANFKTNQTDFNTDLMPNQAALYIIPVAESVN